MHPLFPRVSPLLHQQNEGDDNTDPMSQESHEQNTTLRPGPRRCKVTPFPVLVECSFWARLSCRWVGVESRGPTPVACPAHTGQYVP